MFLVLLPTKFNYVCVSHDKAVGHTYVLKTESILQSSKCVTIRLNCHIFLCTPRTRTMLSGKERTKEDLAGQNKSVLHTSQLAIPIMARKQVRNELIELYTSAKLNNLVKYPQGQTATSHKCKEFEVSCMAYFRQQLETEGLSGRTSNMFITQLQISWKYVAWLVYY